MAKKNIAKNVKKHSKLILIVSAAAFVVGLALLLFAVVTPAGKTYIHREDDAASKIQFKGQEFQLFLSADDDEPTFSYLWKLEDGKVMVKGGLINDYIETCEFHGTKLTSSAGDSEYVSAGAIVLEVCGIVLMVVGGLAALGTAYVAFFKKK